MKGKLGGFIIAGIVVSLFLAFFISSLASSQPDGLERVAEDKGFLDTAQDHALGDLPTADYGIRGIQNSLLSTGLAGVIGVGVTFLIAFGLFALVRKTGGGQSSGDATGH